MSGRHPVLLLLPLVAATAVMVAVPGRVVDALGWDAIWWMGVPTVLATAGTVLALLRPTLGVGAVAFAVASALIPWVMGECAVFVGTLGGMRQWALALDAVWSALAARAIGCTYGGALLLAVAVGIGLRRQTPGWWLGSAFATGLAVVAAGRALEAFVFFEIFDGWNTMPEVESWLTPTVAQPGLDEVLHVDEWAAPYGLAARWAPVGVVLGFVGVMSVAVQRGVRLGAHPYALTLAVAAFLASVVFDECAMARMQHGLSRALVVQPWDLVDAEDFQPLVLEGRCMSVIPWDTSPDWYRGEVHTRAGERRPYERPEPRALPTLRASAPVDVARMDSPAMYRAEVRELAWSDAERALAGQFSELTVAADRRLDADGVREALAYAVRQGHHRVDFIGVHAEDVEHGVVRQASHPLLSPFPPELVSCAMLTRAVLPPDGEGFSPFAATAADGPVQVRAIDDDLGFELGDDHPILRLQPNSRWPVYVWVGDASLPAVVDTNARAFDSRVLPVILDDHAREPEDVLTREDADPGLTYWVRGPLRTSQVLEALEPAVPGIRGCWADVGGSVRQYAYARVEVEVVAERVVELEIPELEPQGVRPCLEDAARSLRFPAVDESCRVGFSVLAPGASWMPR